MNKSKVFNNRKDDFVRFINATPADELKAKLIAILKKHDALIVRSK